jgi:type VI secretion system secreted protein VgrG
MNGQRPIRLLFQAGSYGPEVLLVTGVFGTEAISELYRFEIELASQDLQIDLEALIGQPGRLTLGTADGNRYVHGVISRMEATGFGVRFARYRAVLVPAVWPLTLRCRSRIYEELPVPEILRQVLEADSIPSDRFRIEAAEAHPVREYCVQYRESDWNFVSRLMEEEGIFYFHRHDEEGAVLHVADGSPAFPEIEGETTIPYREPQFGVADRDQVWQSLLVTDLRPGRAVLKDYDFRRPTLQLIGAFGEGQGPEVYDYPGGFQENPLGATLATVRLQEARTGRLSMVGMGNVPCFRPGHRFTLENHPRGEMNREYLILQVLHRGSQEQAAQEETAGEIPTVYHNTFVCAPSEAPYRPPRHTPRPRVDGPQTARVVGPSEEEIHTDKHGRIRVEFHWNCHDGVNDQSSCWMRVSQTWAGAGWGALFLPRIGHEVVVQFLEGDPDRPLVTGSVYNGANPPPYNLPEEKTKSTIRSESSPGGGGFNELRFEDARGSEEIFLHGQKDWNTTICNDRTHAVGHDERMEVGNDRRRAVGRDEQINIERDRELNVGVNERETVGGNRVLEVVLDQQETVMGSSRETVFGPKTEQCHQSRSLIVGEACSVTVGAALSEAVEGDRTEDVGGSKTEAVTGDSAVQIGGTHSLEITGDLMGKVASNLQWVVDGEVSLQVKKKALLQVLNSMNVDTDGSITIECGGDITLKAGGASVVLKKSGMVQIQGSRLHFKASGDTKIKGASVAIN